MALIPAALSPLANSIDRVFPDKWMIRLQETLIRSGMYVKASDLITLIIGAGIIIGSILTVPFLALGQNPIIAFIRGLIAPTVINTRLDILHDGTQD